jgi:hypothetical protein
MRSERIFTMHLAGVISASVLKVSLLTTLLVGCHVEGHYFAPDATPPNTHVLRVQVGGNGSGIVTAAMDGLMCSASACTGEFVEATAVTLSATSTIGAFLGWAGDCSGQSACTVTMDRDRSVGALFGTPGAALWVKQVGGTDRDYGRSIAVDGHGDLIAVGAFRGTIAASVTGMDLVSAGGYDLYVVKLAGATGNVLWAKRFGGTADDYISSVAVDGSNNVYVLGSFQGQVDFGSGPLVPTGSTAVFVLAIDQNGGFRWVRKLDGTNLGAGAGAITADNAANVAVAGSYQGTLTVDTMTFTSAGGADLYALKLTGAVGATVWARSFGGASRDYANGVALDGGGNVVLTGMFENAINFGGGPLSVPTGLNGFLLKLASANGQHLLSRQFGGTKLSQGQATAVDPTNSILITGSFQDTMDLGCANTLTSHEAGKDDVFLAKFSQAGACTWAKGFTGMANGATTAPTRAVSAVAVNGAGDVAIAGAFCGSISFGLQPLASASICPETNAFAARFLGDGTHLSSVRAGGTVGGFASGVAQAVDGRFFATGDFSGFAEFGGAALTALGPTDAFIVGFAPR